MSASTLPGPTLTTPPESSESIGWISAISTAVSGRSVLTAGPQPRNTYQTIPTWFDSVYTQLRRLAALRPGWDGYGGEVMTLAALEAFTQFILHNDHFIQRAPGLALTAEGGLLARWATVDSALEMEFRSESDVEIDFVQAIDASERTGTYTEFPDLPKLLWRASSAGAAG